MGPLMRSKVSVIAHMSMFLLLISLSWAQADEPAAPMMSKPMGNIEDFVDHDPGECAPDGIAVGGFDVVTYRTEGGPVSGSADIAASYKGLTYHFINTENRRAFEKQPEYYLPRYSGWCAVTLALGRLTCPDYTSFKIENDELLLFEVTGFTNGRTLWDTDASGFRVRADDNFLKLTEPSP